MNTLISFMVLSASTMFWVMLVALPVAFAMKFKPSRKLIDKYVDFY